MLQVVEATAKNKFSLVVDELHGLLLLMWTCIPQILLIADFHTEINLILSTKLSVNTLVDEHWFQCRKPEDYTTGKPARHDGHHDLGCGESANASSPWRTVDTFIPIRFAVETLYAATPPDAVTS